MLWPLYRFYFEASVSGLENIPLGPCVLVGNHSGGMTPGDAVFFLHFVRERGAGEPVYIMGTRLLTRIPGLRRVLAWFGVVEGNRVHARLALERGCKVLVYPGGDYDSLRPFRERKRVRFHQRKGFVHVAAQSAVPLVPIATSGSHGQIIVLWQGRELARTLGLGKLNLHSFPIILCLPWGILIGPLLLLPCLPLPVKIQARVLEPITDANVDTVRAYDRVVRQLEAAL